MRGGGGSEMEDEDEKVKVGGSGGEILEGGRRYKVCSGGCEDTQLEKLLLFPMNSESHEASA